MTTSQTKPIYHVRHDLQPKLTQELLLLLWDKSPCKISTLKATALERGYRLADRSPDQLISSLGNLRMIKRNDRGEIQLSKVGTYIADAAKYRPELVPEFIHLRYYTLYDEVLQAQRFSWAYQSVCDYLWTRGHVVVDSHHLIAFIQEAAEHQFQDYDLHGVSFSQNSVNGILNWLEALDPPCITRSPSGERLFSRRTCCPPETILVALEYARARISRTGSSQLQLSVEVRNLLERLCLLDEDSLIGMLDVVAQSFGLIYRHTERGQWISVNGDKGLIPVADWFTS